ncbi:MAG: glycosyltransferase family 2 protein [Solirubrobacteraceae bacterium]
MARPDAERSEVSVCICTRDRPDDLARTLASIVQSTWPVAQVVVSDDGHDRATELVCEQSGIDVNYVLGPQRGLGANRNAALAAVAGDYVLFLDDDCLLTADFLATALARMHSAEKCYGAGRAIVSGGERNRGALISAADQTFLGFQAKPYTSDIGLRSIVINATVFPARLFSHLRFDPQLIYGYEEVDLASRAAAAGYVVVHCADALNDHRPSPRGREDYDRQVEASRLHVTLRRYALTERATWKALAFVLIAPVHLVAANVKRSGVAGVGRSVQTISLATTMLWRAREDR